MGLAAGLVGKRVKLFRRYEGGTPEGFPFLAEVLAVEDGVMRVRSFDPQDLGLPDEFRNRFWIPVLMLGAIEIVWPQPLTDMLPGPGREGVHSMTAIPR